MSSFYPTQFNNVLRDRIKKIHSCFPPSPYGALEINHRSPIYQDVNNCVHLSIKNHFGLQSHKIVLLQAGMYTVYSSLAWNIRGQQAALYLTTGKESQKAYEQAKKVRAVQRVNKIPDSLQGFSYFYFKLFQPSSKTVIDLPESLKKLGVPIVCDITHALWHHPPLKDFDVIVGDLSQGLGIEGSDLVLYKDCVLKDDTSKILDCFNWKSNEQKKSVLNSPNTFSVFVLAEVFKLSQKRTRAELLEKHQLFIKRALSQKGFSFGQFYSAQSQSDLQNLGVLAVVDLDQ